MKKAVSLALLSAILLIPPASAAEKTFDLSDLMAPGGELKAKDSIYDRWVAAAGVPQAAEIVRFLDANFVLRDGAKLAAGSAGPESRMSASEALERMASADVIFFGEQHNEAGAHLLEVLLLRLLDERCGADVCMEMFETQSRTTLEDYVSGRMDEKAFLEKLSAPEIKGLWQNYRKDYRPIVEYSREKGRRIAAGFPPRRLASDLAKKGEAEFYRTIREEDRSLCATRISEPLDESYRKRCINVFDGTGDYRRGQLLEMAEKDPAMLRKLKPMILGKAGAGAMGGMMSGNPELLYRAQLFKDSTMAEIVKGMAESSSGRKVFAVAGAGHVSFRGGAVGVLEALAPGLKVVTVVFETPRTSSPPSGREQVQADVMIFGDRIETYVQELPAKVTIEEAEKRIREMEGLALLAVYRSNGEDQKKAMEDIEKARGLKFKYPMYARIMTAEESKSEVGGWARAPEAASWLAVQEKVLRMFNLYSGGRTLAEAQSDRSSESIMGFYRPADKVLYLFPEQAGDRLRGLRVHESIHALQDQHFDLARLRSSVANSEEDAALTALIEGEAVYLMMQVLGMSKGLEKMLGGGGGGGHGGMGGGKPPAPDYFSERTRLMYRAGAQFVKALAEKGGWEKVTEAYGRRPSSTSEILHPERWFEGFKPESVSLPPVSGGWKEIANDVLGEADFAVMLKLGGLSDDESAGAASSWRGDRYRLEVKDAGSPHRLVYLSAWADEKSAETACGHLGRVLPGARVSARGRLCAAVRELNLD